MRNGFFICCLSFLTIIILIYSCKKNPLPTPFGNKTLISFEFRDFNPTIICTVGSDDTIRGTLPAGTSLSNLRPTITHNGASISPLSGEAKDFTNVVTYTVTPESGSPKNYYAKITVQKSDEKKILLFNFNAFNPIVTGAIDEPNRKVQFRFSASVDPNGQVPTIMISNGATISPGSGLPQNFFSPQVYFVTAENNTQVLYSTELLRPNTSSKDVPTPPKYLCIYYAWPSVINGSTSDAAAVNEFKKFDIIVLGDGLWKPTHGDYTRTKNIISLLKAAKPSVRIFGYIDLGVKLPSQNLPDIQLRAAIDGWQLMGVHGVFGDDFGSDWWVDRIRQNGFIDYAHSKNMSVFANAWIIDDALGGNDCHLSSTNGDYYLMESFLVENGGYTTLQNNIDKANKAYYYMKNKGVGIACVSTLVTVSATSNTTDKYKMAWHGTAMYNFDAFQFTDLNYSSSTASVFQYPNPITNYGSSWQQWDWIKKITPTRYERATNTNTFYIDGDGVTIGTGGH